ncbi:ABC transporter ATP-binding protein [Aeromicrobium sp. IC_218]|uniref:ABC transporter ATP-binding protein n=1 Tax=Aeromicrobium sp. IC_218 TaxID=2545468 RepID=UPI00103D9523|nr:ABC transporter ATP-binding protein [Aeromicrobium sp. IC_218]TCI99786.1 ABC transporter ATP-binding protein [Aeromicrobium sp. IC_218]
MSVDTAAPDDLTGTDDRIMRRGFGLLGRGIVAEKWWFTVSVVGSLLYGAMTVADAWVLGWATDHVIRPSFERGDVAEGALWTSVFLFIGVAVLRALGIVGRRLVGGLVYYRLIADYRRRVTRQYLSLPMSWHHRHPTGQLLSNANADVEATWAVFMPLPMALGVVAMLLTAIVAMVEADVVLTLVGLVVFPALFGINVFYQRWLSPKAARAQSLRGDVSAVAHESFDGATVVKSLGREADETERFRAATERLRDANIEVGRIRSVFDPLLEALPNLGILLVIVLGVGRVASGAAEPGDVVQVAYLFTVVAFPVRAIGWVLGELPRSVVSWDRVDSVLAATGSMQYGDRTLPGAGAVQLDLRDVTYTFPDADRPVLSHLDLHVGRGSVTAVVGSTGSGKSTLTSLLVRLVDPEQGRVELDGVDVRTLTHDDLAAAVALVPQSTFLFDDSVRENVTLGSEHVDDATVWDALRTVQAEDFVRALPDGLDTQLGERGTTLSGGQRQRLALARALVRRPRLLVMDDATSALDPDVERRILSELAARTSDGTGPTVLVVAYRKATIALADEVVFLQAGRIADRGPHHELVVRSAAYRDLVDAYDQAREAQ